MRLVESKETPCIGIHCIADFLTSFARIGLCPAMAVVPCNFAFMAYLRRHVYTTLVRIVVLAETTFLLFLKQSHFRTFEK